MQGADVVVVGGGVIGCSVAFGLAREGVSVAVLERGDVAGQASGAAAGMLLPTGEAPGAGPLLSWGLRGLARFPSLCAELLERTGIDAEFVPSGALHVADDPERWSALSDRAASLDDLDLEWLDAEAACAAEPALTRDVHGAVWSPREGHVRPPLLVRALAAAAEQLGARIERGIEVEGLLRSGDRVIGARTSRGDIHSARIVLCAGAWTPALSAWLGAPLNVPIEPVRGQILFLDPPLPALPSIIVGNDVYLVPKRDGSLVVGATEERVGFDTRVTAGGVGKLLGSASDLIPGLSEATFRGAWAGLRPGSPDGLPLIGLHPGADEVLLAAGHSRNGVLLAPVTGELICDLVRGKPLPPEASVFSVSRFC